MTGGAGAGRRAWGALLPRVLVALALLVHSADARQGRPGQLIQRPEPRSEEDPMAELEHGAADEHAAADASLARDIPAGLLTVAESSGFARTATHAEVVALLDRLADLAPWATRLSMGQSHEDRELPLLVLADPPVASAEQARAGGKAVVFVFADIHAGEVCGKEALPMLARELLLDPDGAAARAWLAELVLVFAPIYNADGNERMAPDNRPGQLGPERMGTRANAQGLDLNRDYVKALAPETHAMLRVLTEWDPQLVVDLHTTNGSLHRYDLTYAPPLNPEGPAAPLELVRDRLLPDVRERLRARTGRETFLYGNFDAERTRWSTYSSHPRFGAQYHGLRGHAAVLSEAYSYLPFEQRVLVTREFVREVLQWAAEHAGELREAVARGREQVREAVERAAPIGLRHALAAADEPATILTWEARLGPEGVPADLGAPVELEVVHEDHFEPTLSVPRPAGYLLPPGCDGIARALERHGIALHRVGDSAAARAGPGALREPLSGPVPVERWTITSITRAERPFEGHRLTSVEAERADALVEVDARWYVVPLDQDLGTLAAWLLEPLSEDGLVAWQLFDRWLAVGEGFPVLRVNDRAAALLRR